MLAAQNAALAVRAGELEAANAEMSERGGAGGIAELGEFT
jgi:hypothetical protein